MQMPSKLLFVGFFLLSLLLLVLTVLLEYQFLLAGGLCR